MPEFQSQLNHILTISMEAQGGFNDVSSTLIADINTLPDDIDPLKEKRVSVVEYAPWFNNEYRNKHKERISSNQVLFEAYPDKNLYS